MKELTDKEKIEMLKSFAFDVIKEFGNIPSKTTYLTINDIAVKHGLGKKELRKEPCSKDCRCALFMDGNEFFDTFYCSQYEKWMLE